MRETQDLIDDGEYDSPGCTVATKTQAMDVLKEEGGVTLLPRMIGLLTITMKILSNLPHEASEHPKFDHTRHRFRPYHQLIRYSSIATIIVIESLCSHM